MHNANFYEELKNKMTFHDMLYNEYVDFKLGTPLDEENFNILQGNIVGYVRMSEEGKRKIGIHRKKVCSHLADTLNAALTDAEQQDLSDIYDRLVIYFKKMVDANKSQKL